MLRFCPACAVQGSSGVERALTDALTDMSAPPLRIITCDAVFHVVPAAWIADRRAAFERDGLTPVDSLRAAYLEWAATCEAGQES